MPEYTETTASETEAGRLARGAEFVNALASISESFSPSFLGERAVDISYEGDLSFVVSSEDYHYDDKESLLKIVEEVKLSETRRYPFNLSISRCYQYGNEPVNLTAAVNGINSIMIEFGDIVIPESIRRKTNYDNMNGDSYKISFEIQI